MGWLVQWLSHLLHFHEISLRALLRCCADAGSRILVTYLSVPCRLVYLRKFPCATAAFLCRFISDKRLFGPPAEQGRLALFFFGVLMLNLLPYFSIISPDPLSFEALCPRIV